MPEKRRKTQCKAVVVRYEGAQHPEMAGKMMKLGELATVGGHKKATVYLRWVRSGRPSVVNDSILAARDMERYGRFMSAKPKKEVALAHRKPVVDPKPWPPKNIDDVIYEPSSMERSLLGI